MPENLMLADHKQTPYAYNQELRLLPVMRMRLPNYVTV
jgi:hypothetical protein